MFWWYPLGFNERGQSANYISNLSIEKIRNYNKKYFSVYILRSSFSQSNIYSLSAKTHKNSLTISNCNELKMKSKRRLKVFYEMIKKQLEDFLFYNFFSKCYKLDFCFLHYFFG